MVLYGTLQKRYKYGARKTIRIASMRCFASKQSGFKVRGVSETAFPRSCHGSSRVHGRDIPMFLPVPRVCPQRGYALVPATDVHMSLAGTKCKKSLTGTICEIVLCRCIAFASTRRIYSRKYVKIFAEKRAHISGKTHTYLRKYVYVFAEINLKAAKMRSNARLCV